MQPESMIYAPHWKPITESALTGESFSVDKQTDPVDKDMSLADRNNMVFKGTSITSIQLLKYWKVLR